MSGRILHDGLVHSVLQQASLSTSVQTKIALIGVLNDDINVAGLPGLVPADLLPRLTYSLVIASVQVVYSASAKQSIMLCKRCISNRQHVCPSVCCLSVRHTLELYQDDVSS